MALQRGDTFGAYRIVARLKAGGMAQLYLARREGAAGFTRWVALKVIHPHLAKQPEFVKMFVDEATLSSKVHDPNVVHVEDLGHAGGSLFLAMEYVHGTSLGNLLRAARTSDRRFGSTFIAHVAAQVASGLHAAHETTDESGRPLGIVHRDVSPQNILFAFKGHIKVIDFGVAKAIGVREATAQGDGALHGKIGYMPPEQAKSGAIDRRADVYALGIVLWEMIVGRRLFDAENDLALLARVRDPKIDRPSAHVSDVPRALDDLVMAMLEKNPAQRPPTALDVKKLVLEAVPDARTVDASDVAALLRALVPEEISQRDNTLSSDGGGDDDTTAFSSGPRSDIVTTDRLVEPSEAFVQFTVPAVMVRDLVGPPSSMREEERTSPRSANRLTLVFALVAVVVLGVVALVVKGSSSPARSTDAVDPSATFPPAPPLPSADPSAESSSVASALPSAPPAVKKPPPPPPPPVRPAKKPPPPPPSAPKGPHCRMVDGVQLCE